MIDCCEYTKGNQLHVYWQLAKPNKKASIR